LLADLDRLTPETERQEVAAHLRVCRSCSEEGAARERVRTAMRALPRMVPPPDLAVRLRVIASREQQRRSEGWARRLATNVRLCFEGLMRPLAVPLAGGICSAVLLFALLVPSFSWVPSAQDVPIGLSTDATVKSMAPIGFEDGEAVVDVTIDDQGHLVDFNILHNYGAAVNDSFCRSVENALLFTVFTPGTAFGQPVGGKLRLTFRSSSVEVKG
jgi:anti-sigma factor RsiW